MGLVLGLAVVSFSLLSAPAFAANESSWLGWSGPVECQNTEEVERQIESLLGEAVNFQQLPRTQVVVDWSASVGWDFLVKVQLETGQRERQVTARTCAEGFDVVALTLALLLDLQLEEASATAQLSDAEETAAGLERASKPVGGSNAMPEVEPSPVEEVAESPKALTNLELWNLTVGGAAKVDMGTLPTRLYGGGGQLGVNWKRWQFEIAAEYLQSDDNSLPNAVAPVRYSVLSGAAQLCRRFEIAEGTTYANCVGGQVGSLSIAEQGGTNRRSSGLWTSAQAGAELGLKVAGKSYGFARLQLLFPLLRHELTLEGGGVVHTLPTISAQIQLGVAFDVTDGTW